MDRYASTASQPRGPGDSRPTAQQIIADEGLKDKWAGRTILITGVSSGLGVETARVLATTGATLFLTARNLTKAKTALGDELATAPNVHLLHLDLESLASVRACAAAFLSQSPRLHILITNAGIRHAPQGTTQDGFEKHWGVNHLAHFLLLQLLLPALTAASTPHQHSRVIALSSTAHRFGTINFTDPNLSQPNAYTPPAAYAQSKLANVYMANEVTRRYSHLGVQGLAVHPGGIRTGLQNQPGQVREFLTWYYVMNLRKVLHVTKSVAQGAATTVWAATARALEGKGGMYLEDCHVSVPVKEGWGLVDPGYVEATYDEEVARRLWEESLRIVDGVGVSAA